MGNATNLPRREFLSRLVSKDAALQDPVTGDPIKDDVYFKKYSNQKLPFQANRTDAGLEPYVTAWTEAEVLHLLRRTMFGATKANVDLLKSMTPSQAVDYLIDNPVLPTPGPLNNYNNTYADTQGCPFGTPWVTYAAPNNNDGTLNSQRTYNSFKPWWMGQMINQPTHILEKITLFWANHFGTDTDTSNAPKAIWKHYVTLRTHGLGNFRTLIKEITTDPHMLVFLNLNSSSRTAPDENYARELQELFMVGKGAGSQYTEADVKAAAKVLTGWRRTISATDGTYSTTFNTGVHDVSNKQFSAFYNNKLITGKTGANGATETDELIDMILQAPEVAKYICRRLYTWFVYYVIDDAAEANVITPLADLFRSSNYEIKPVLKALFNSQHFFDPVNRGCIIKSPVDMYVSLLREFKVTLASSPLEIQYAHWKYFSDRCSVEAQNIGDPPNVSGWPAYYQSPKFYEMWMNASTIQTKGRNINNLTKAGITVNSIKIKVDSVAFNKLFPNPEDPNQVVRNFITYLLPQDLSQSQKDYMKSILLSNQVTDSYWTNAWNAYISNPSDTGALATVQNRLDTLINYITSLEEYFLY
jgi:uncharacterized protein (DUF1800 family)